MLHWDHPQVRELIRLAVAEDVGAGDVTTEACVPVDSQSVGYFLPKQDLTLAGTELLRIIFQEETVEILGDDGTRLRAGQVFAKVAGATRRLLTMERTALNFLQRACGVATLTSRFVETIEGTGCTLLDTRKTSPGMRVINKLSVRAGGGTNHRLGLFDAVLIKNNHVDAAGGLTQAIENCRPTGRAIEVEVRDRAELDEALQLRNPPCPAGQLLTSTGCRGSRARCGPGEVGGIRQRRPSDHPRLCRSRSRLYFCWGTDPLRTGSRHQLQAGVKLVHGSNAARARVNCR